jgi:hypothetical protein
MKLIAQIEINLRDESIKPCRVPKTRGTHNQRLRKTKPTGLAETANETPQPCSDSYEAPSTGRLDHVPTRTRLARQDASTTEKSPTRTTQCRAGRPTSFTNSETKVRAFNATANHFLPSWLQQQPAWKQYRCQISLFTAHPGMDGENLSLCTPYWALFHH